MSVTHFVPAQSGEYGYNIVEPNDNGETTLERFPLIGYIVSITDQDTETPIVQTLPVCNLGTPQDIRFVQRYDGTFTDDTGEQLRYSLEGMMEEFGFEADAQNTRPPTNAKDLFEYVWRPLRNPKD